MNNKNKVDRFRGSLANTRDDTVFLDRMGGRSGDSSKCCLEMSDTFESPLLPPNDPIYTCHSEL